MPYLLCGAGGSKAATSATWHYDKSVSPHDEKYQRSGPDGRWIDQIAYVDDLIAGSSLVLKKSRKVLGNFLDISRTDGFAISDRVRRVLEVLEPGVHDMRPLSIRLQDGRTWEEPYWFCHRGKVPAIEAIDLEASHRWIRWDDRLLRGRRFLNGVIAVDRDPHEVFLDQRAIAGHHFFGEARAAYALGWFFLSDEAVTAMKAAGALGGVQLGRIGLACNA